MTYHHILAAVQRAAKNYHNGIDGLAQIMGKNPKVLANKLNPNSEQNQLSVIEMAEILEITQDTTAIDMLAALTNSVTVPMIDVPACDAERLSQGCLGISAAYGRLAEAVAKSESPDGEWGGRISPSEYAVIKTTAREQMAASVSLYLKIERDSK